jgi:hypothetical protein
MLIAVAPFLGPERINILADYHAARALPERQRAYLEQREKRAV